MVLWIILVLLVVLIFLTVVITYRNTFGVPREKTLNPRELPRGRQYKEHGEELLAAVEEVISIPFEDVCITSKDGLKLHGRVYESDNPDAPVEIMIHGYYSAALRDMCGALKVAQEAGHSVILVDLRAHGESEGKFLSFGIKERMDCLCWIDYAIERFGKECKIFLVGVSMGASTVLMASELNLPGNVLGIIADSAYSSPEKIIRKVCHDRHWPDLTTYPTIYLGALLFGRYKLDAAMPEEAVKKSNIPILLIHGESDRIVPCEMSREIAEASAGDVTLEIIPGAAHGFAYLTDWNRYQTAIMDFVAKQLY